MAARSTEDNPDTISLDLARILCILGQRRIDGVDHPAWIERDADLAIEFVS